MTTYKSFSSIETKKLGARLAREVLKQKPKKEALVLGLDGNLGAGKTTFTQGFVGGLGVKSRVLSPTFIMMRRFAIKKRHFKNLYHVDCYRVKKPEELSVLGLRELFKDPQNIVLIEWPDRIKKLLPGRAMKINFNYGKKENERTITFKKT